MTSTHRFIIALACLVTPCMAAAQTDTTSVPLPPAERLEALDSFFGTWDHDGNYFAGMGPWKGTMTVGPAVKGWYVEWVIDTRSGPIDRMLRMLVTWDEDLSSYRVWRFETLPQTPPGTVEGQARFAGNEFVMEWPGTPGPDGQTGLFRNRIRLEGRDEIVIVSEVEPDTGGRIVLSEWRSRRGRK